MPTRLLAILLALLCPPALVVLFGHCFQARLIFPALRLPRNHRFSPHKRGREVWIETGDGARLNAIEYRNFNSRRILLFLHGNGGNLEYWRFEYDHLEHLGLDALFLDYRGYGKSDGDVSEEGLYRDAQAAFDYLLAQGYAESEIVIYGSSMGSSIATHLAQDREVSAVILEAPYTSLREMIYNEYWYMLPWFCLRYTFDNARKAARLKARLLILHGTGDLTVPFKYGKALYACYEGPKRLEAIEGGGHRDLNRFPQKRAALQSFLGVVGPLPALQ